MAWRVRIEDKDLDAYWKLIEQAARAKPGSREQQAAFQKIAALDSSPQAKRARERKRG